MTRSPRELTVRVRCPTCEVVDLRADDVYFSATDGIVDDLRARCSTCHATWCVSDDPGVLALLHGFGIDVVRPGLSGPRPHVGDERALVSLRLLLDDPGFIATLATMAPASRTPIGDEDTDAVH
jgi:hypothetical protein